MKRNKYLLILTLSLLLLAPVFGTFPTSAQSGTKPGTIVFITEPDAANAITMLEAGELDIYSSRLTDRDLLGRVKAAPELDFFLTWSVYFELTFNPAGPVFNNGKLNPFAVPRVREAMNYLIDREHISEEIMGSLGAARWTALKDNDGALLATEVRAIELKYAYNPQLAKQIIDEQMLSLGAVFTGGVWHYNAEPVEILVLIRIEDERLPIGDYVADQLEAIGFQVVRDYKPWFEASPIWLEADPNDGLFHIYTGGWGSTAIDRWAEWVFAYFYTDMGRGELLWQAYVNDPEFYDLAARLDEGNFGTFSERRAMMARALELSLMDSVRIFLSDRREYIAKQNDLSLAADMYRGMNSSLWAKTIQRMASGRSGNNEVMIAVDSLFNAPWNPIGGAIWDNDIIPLLGTADFGIVSDLYTGLCLPDRISRAEVVVLNEHIIKKTMDWVDLAYEDEIIVPGDAWGGWHAGDQRFIPVSELSPGETVTAQMKSTVFYPEDLFDTVKWHDGTAFSIADILMYMILTFDRAQEDSPIYDGTTVGEYEWFMWNFKGVRIISENPLVIETYLNHVPLDAENSITTWWPYYAQGQGAWHGLNLGIRAEAAGEGAFSSSKAESAEIPWLDYVVDTEGILSGQLAIWEMDRVIPYGPTLGEYIDQAELDHRIANLQNWFNEHGHYWIGTGPYFLETTDRTMGTLTLQRFMDHPDPDDRWDDYAEDPIPNVQVFGPGQFVLGGSTIFDIFITQGADAAQGQNHLQGIGLRSGQPYSSENIERVDYLLFVQNTVLLSGQADYIDEGHYQVVIDQSTASLLPSGVIQLEVIVVSNRVVIASTANTSIDNQKYNIFLPLILH